MDVIASNLANADSTNGVGDAYHRKAVTMAESTGGAQFSLPRPAGLGGPSPAMRTWHHTLAARDIASGLALTLAPAGPALRAATLFRIVSDLTDAVAFGLNAPGPARKGKALAATLSYATLAAASLRWAGR